MTKKLKTTTNQLALDVSSDKDGNNCAVTAMVNLLGIDYKSAYNHFQEAGRLPKKGVTTKVATHAFKLAGYALEAFDSSKIISRYPGIHKTLKHVTSWHPRRFRTLFTEKDTYYCSTSKHAFAMVKGEVIDWSSEKQLQIKNLYTVSPLSVN